MLDLEALSAKVDREVIAREGLLEFVRRAWQIVEPTQPYVENWHHRTLCRCIEACVAGEPWAVRQVVNMPPGTSKSLLFSVFLPAWVWTVWPGFKSIYASYDIGISRRDARRTLQILQSSWYRARWPEVVLVGKAPAETDFANTAGGFRFATSVESTVTGRHAHLRVVDDPIKPLDACGTGLATGQQLEKVIDWWRGTMATRVVDHSCPRYLIIMQRLAENDLAGYLTSKDVALEDRPTKIVFPMSYDSSDPFIPPADDIPGDPRTKDGELFWPARFSEQAVAALARDLGQHAQAQLQQKPNSAKGSTFNADYFHRYDQDPHFLAKHAARVILSVDAAFKGKADSDRVAVQVWAEMRSEREVRRGITVGVWYALLDCFADRLSFLKTLAQIRKTLKEWPEICGILVEDKANGSAVIETLQQSVPGVIPVEPDGGKEARAQATQPIYAGHNVAHPTAEYCPQIVEYESELLKFPRGKNDDQVDATTQALRYLAGKKMSVLDALEATLGL